MISYGVFFLLYAVALLFSYIFPQAENYGYDINFTNANLANYAIAMAPLLIFSFIGAAFWGRQPLLNVPMTGVKGGMIGFAAFAYIVAILFIFALIVLQPDWSPYFRFYSEFDNQGRGG